MLHETIAGGTVAPNTVYNTNICLYDFARSKALAQYFQWYRIVKVEYRYTPYFNVSQQPGAVATQPSLPQMLMVMNRNGWQAWSTRAQLEAQGARPRLFTKNLKVSYRPNNIIQTAYAGQGNYPSTTTNTAVGVSERTFGWISTKDPTSSAAASLQVPYYGHSVLFAEDNAGTLAQGIGNCEIHIWVEYKEASAIAS
jgi:hypothetical protein